MDEFGGIPVDDFGGVLVEEAPTPKVAAVTPVGGGPPDERERPETMPVAPETPPLGAFGGPPIGGIRDLLKTGFAVTPAKSLPRFNIPPTESVPLAVGKEALNIAAGIPEFLSSPLGLVTMGAAGVAPTATAAAFTVDMAKNLGNQVLSTYQDWSKMTPAQKAVALTDIAGTGFMGLLTGRATAKGLRRMGQPEIAPVTAPTEAPPAVVEPKPTPKPEPPPAEAQPELQAELAKELAVEPEPLPRPPAVPPVERAPVVEKAATAPLEAPSPERPPKNPFRLYLKEGENMNDFLKRATDEELVEAQRNGELWEKYLKEEQDYRKSTKDATWKDLNPMLYDANHFTTDVNWERVRRSAEAKPPPLAQGKAAETPPPTTPTVSEAAKQVSAIPEPAAASAIREAKPIEEVSQEDAVKSIYRQLGYYDKTERQWIYPPRENIISAIETAKKAGVRVEYQPPSQVGFAETWRIFDAQGNQAIFQREPTGRTTWHGFSQTPVFPPEPRRGSTGVGKVVSEGGTGVVKPTVGRAEGTTAQRSLGITKPPPLARPEAKAAGKVSAGFGAREKPTLEEARLTWKATNLGRSWKVEVPGRTKPVVVSSVLGKDRPNVMNATQAVDAAYRAVYGELTGSNLATPPASVPSAVSKVTQEVQKVAKTEGQRSAKEIKTELIHRLENSLKEAPTEADLKISKTTGLPLYRKGVEQSITIDIPGDGIFSVVNRKDIIAEVLAAARQISTSPGGSAKIPGARSNLEMAEEASAASKAYGSPENAYRSVKRQRDALQSQEPPGTSEERNVWNSQIEKADFLLREIYGSTKAGMLEANAEALRDRLSTYRSGAQGFEKEIARIKAIKRQTKAHKERLEDLEKRYAQNQEFIRTNERNAEQLEQQAAKEKAALETQVKPAPAEAKPVGMGGAVPSEFIPVAGTSTGIKNAAVDQQRAQRGLSPILSAARRTVPEVYTEAMAKIDAEPEYQDRLINDLREHPRTLTPVEEIAMLQRETDYRNEFAKVTRDLAQAYDDGRMDAVAELKARYAEWSDRMTDLEEIMRKVGTAWGISGRFRQLMMREDYSLAAMETRLRSAKGGERLTEAEAADLRDISAKLQKSEKAFEDYVEQAQKRIVDLEMKVRMAELEKQAKAQPQIPEVIIRVAERIVGQLDTRADAARKRIRERMGRVSAGVDPTILLDLAEIGASHIGHIGLDFAKWSARMVEDVGEWVKPHLQQVFKASQDAIDALSVTEKVKRVVKKQSPTEQKQAILEQVTELIQKDEKSRVSFFLQKLARMFYEDGITEREKMVGALHNFMLQVKPDITREEVARVWSGYGEYKQLSKDQITVALRGMKGELQQLAKLEDMAAGVPPAKSGLERRTPTEAERQLVKRVNDAKYKFQIPVQDPNTQLKSALDTLKITLRNRIVDYEDRMARGDYAPRPRREVVLDKEAQQLKAEAERVKIRFRHKLNQYRLANRTKGQKLGDWFVKWQRAFKLSSPVVFGKLGAAAMTRFATTTAEEVVGSGLGRVPGIFALAARAPREGGINVKAMAKAAHEAFTIGMRDAAQTARRGETDLDIVLGSKGGADPDWANFFGQLHGMMKAPVKRAEYELSLQKRLEWAIKNGVDVSDPLVQMRLQTEALNDGYRTIFMQHGFTADTFNTLVRTLENTKRYPRAGFVTAKTLRFFFPIVRVPINIVSETFTGVHGLATASARTMFHAMNTGLKDLDPVVADSIMRQFKKGSIGAALMAIGYMNAENIGGYDWREKRRPGTPKTMQFRIFDMDIPKWMTHAPWFELMQMGATVRRVKEQHVASTGQEKGFTEGAWAAGLGLLDETPFYGELMRAARGVETATGRRNFGGELARGTLIPQAVQWVAKQADYPDVRRKPTNLGEHLKMGIPGLREEVPIAPNR